MKQLSSPAPSSDARALSREIFRELIEIDTTHATGSTTVAAEAMRRRLLAAGMPESDVVVLGPRAGKGNLVARMRGSGDRGPILLLAHLDVVDALPSEWSVNPFELTERDGHFYGRGTTDDKAMAAIWVANLIRYVELGFQPDRDVIVALTADEEGGDHNGAEWLLREHPDRVDAEFGLNEGGYGRKKGGRRIANVVQAGEKTYLDLELLAEGRGGHSSIALQESAITILAEAVARLSRHRFPVLLSEVTRGFFARMAEIEEGEIASDMRASLQDPADPGALDRLSAVPYYNGLLRNTAVVTRLQAGEENNTVPSTARAVVNCRILPGESAADLEREIAGVIEDDRIRIRALAPAQDSPPAPLTDEIMGPVQRVTGELWPGVPVLPVMGIGGTDSRHFRRAGIPMYGVSGIFLDVDDVRAHAPDERVGVEAFFEGQEFLFRLVRQLAQSTAVSDAGREV